MKQWTKQYLWLNPTRPLSVSTVLKMPRYNLLPNPSILQPLKTSNRKEEHTQVFLSSSLEYQIPNSQEKVAGQEIVQQLCIQTTTCQSLLYIDILEQLQVTCSIDSAEQIVCIQNSDFGFYQPARIQVCNLIKMFDKKTWM